MHGAPLRGQPRAVADAARGLQGAIQHSAGCSAALERTDNKSQNCAHALGTVRLCSSARINLLCALIMHCAKPPFTAAAVCPVGALELPVFSPAAGNAAAELR